MARTVSPQENKHRFILSALHLFAAQGIAAVSLRTVNRAVGQKNTSAVHYHFGDKEGLVGSVLSFIQDWFSAKREDALKALEHAAKERRIETSEVLSVWAAPYAELTKTEDWGYAGIRLIALLQFDPESSGREAHSRVAKEALNRLNALMEASLPELPSIVVRHRFALCINSIVQNLANACVRLSTPTEEHADQLSALIQVYLEQHTAGMQAKTEILPSTEAHKRLVKIPNLF